MQSMHPSPEGVMLGLILVSAWGVLFLLDQIIKQQGRLLLRLDGIEQHLGILRPAVAAGLAVGKPFPSFKLPDLDGKQVALEGENSLRMVDVTVARAAAARGPADQADADRLLKLAIDQKKSDCDM